MNHVTRLLTLLAFFAVVRSAPAQEAMGGHEEHAAAQHVVIAAEEIEWVPAPPVLPPGAQSALLEGDPTKEGPFTTRIRMPAGYRIPPHTHPVIAHLTVLSGRVGAGIGETWDDAEMRFVGPGGYFILAPGVAHFEIAEEESVVQLNAIGPWGVTYVNPADDPRNASP